MAVPEEMFHPRISPTTSQFHSGLTHTVNRVARSFPTREFLHSLIHAASSYRLECCMVATRAHLTPPSPLHRVGSATSLTLEVVIHRSISGMREFRICRHEFRICRHEFRICRHEFRIWVKAKTNTPDKEWARIRAHTSRMLSSHTVLYHDTNFRFDVSKIFVRHLKLPSLGDDKKSGFFCTFYTTSPQFCSF